jgi:hypothetical protein
MKSLREYLLESYSVNEDKGTGKIDQAIQKMKPGDRIPCVFGVRMKVTDRSGKDRMVDTAMYIIKHNKTKYEFCPDFCFRGVDMIKDICKKLGIKRFAVLTDMAIRLDYEELIQVLQEMPNFFSKYSNGMFTFLTYSYDEAVKECAKQKIPFEIKTLEQEIADTENSIKDLEAKKQRLQQLKSAQNSDSWTEVEN